MIGTIHKLRKTTTVLMKNRDFLSLVFLRLESYSYTPGINHHNSLKKNIHVSLSRKIATYSNRKGISNLFAKNMGCSTSSLNKPTASTSAAETPEDDFIEGVVCKESDLNENEMKTFELGDDSSNKVLVVKQKGQISAIGPKCTHYGAPLVNGALGDGRIRCQWHGACFNILTGDIEDFPGLDSLPCYKVTIEDGNVKVRARKSELQSNKRVKKMVKRNMNEAQSIVVVGGGPAGATCVEVLRQEGFEGQITLVCKENCLPYDRVKVSKAMDFEISKAEFRTDKFYAEWGIEVLKGVEAVAVDANAKTVKLSNNKELNYDRLFIATGSKPRKVDVPGADLKNVIVLRDYEHSKYTNALLDESKDVVVLGGSYIAMEAANYCLNKVKSVTVVIRDVVPFKASLGTDIGAAFLKLFEEKGVKFVKSNSIARCNDDGAGNVASVELKDGTILKADLVVMGTGSTFYTDFVRESGIDVRDDGTIETNEFLQTNKAEVYAGGDIAFAPVWSHHNAKAAIGHFPLAHYHGKIAALNMLNKQTAMEAVPYFWTMLFGKGVRYAGHGKYDDVLYAGNVNELKFVAFYLKEDEVVAVSSCGMDPVVSQFAECLSQNKKLYRKDLGDDYMAWTK